MIDSAVIIVKIMTFVVVVVIIAMYAVKMTDLSHVIISVIAHRAMCLLKSVGVKLKVYVKDDDYVYDDDVDGLVQLLRLTPARSASTASWTTITMRGLRSSHKTRSVDVFFLPNLSGVYDVGYILSVRIYLSLHYTVVDYIASLHLRLPDARVHGPCTRASGFHYPS